MERFRTVRVRNYVRVHTFQKRKNHCSRFAMSQSTSIKNRAFLMIASWKVCFFTVKILMQKLGAHELWNFLWWSRDIFIFTASKKGFFLISTVCYLFTTRKTKKLSLNGQERWTFRNSELPGTLDGLKWSCSSRSTGQTNVLDRLVTISLFFWS